MVDYRSIESTAKILAKENNINYYELLQRFMFERILERISVSNYSRNFILKGGLLLSAMFGIDNRATKDIDATIKGLNLEKDNMLKIITNILSIDLKDGVKFKIIDVMDIREDDEYNGIRYSILAILHNLKVNLEIDISTGDKITPKELKYKYPLIFSNKEIIINSYNIETILSEKIETILRRTIYNSRMKDYYDVYLFLTKLKKHINFDILKLAINNTFKKRKSISYLEDYKAIMNSISKSKRLEELWEKYKNKRNYLNNIRFSTVVNKINDFLETITH